MKPDTEKFQRLVDDVLDVHRDVRFAALFDDQGNKITGGMKKGVRSLDPPKTSSQVDRDTALYPAMLAANGKYFGKFGYMYVEMEKFSAMAFQVGPNYFLVVTTDPPTGLEVVPNIRNLVERF